MKNNFKKWKVNLKDLEYNNLYPLFFTLIFIFILIQYSFHSLDAIFFDLWTRTNIFPKTNSEVVIVTIDEESDQFLGEKYPYTYATHNRFLKKLLSSGPRGIGFLGDFDHIENQVDKTDMMIFKKKINQFKSDQTFVRFGLEKKITDNDFIPRSLRDVGDSIVLLDQDTEYFAKDGVTRRAILNVGGEDSFNLWIANKIQEIKKVDVTDAKSFFGSHYDSETDATYAYFGYTDNPITHKKMKSIPFHRVVVGNFPQDFFDNKVVIVGPAYISQPNDFTLTPYGKEGVKAFKIYVHGQIIDSLVNKDTIYPVIDRVTDVVAIIIAIFLSFIISRVQPAKGLIITMTLMLGIFLIAYLSFVIFGLWFKLAHLILSIFVVYYIWVPFRAIGEYQTRYAIEEEAKVLKKVDKLKHNFISLMSHDLKTPVAKIAGIADILKVQYENNEKQDELLGNIVESTKELNNFITSILDLTKIESQEMALKLESKDVNNLVEQVVNGLRFEASSKSMKINTELDPLYPIQVDVNLIHRVFSNIIGNAIKYAGQKKAVNIKTYDDEQWVYIEISDNGKGIPEDEIDHIFEKFYRVKNDESHKIKGSGLGLYLVKYFIELHHGQITVESVIEQGTKFLIKLKNE